MDPINKYVEAFKSIGDFQICKHRVLAELKMAAIANSYVEDFIPSGLIRIAEKNMDDTKDIVLSNELRSLLDVVSKEPSSIINSIYTHLVA